MRYHLDTARLGFGLWEPALRPLAHRLWGDPAVTRYISANGRFDAAQVDARFEAECSNQARHGVAYWPVFLKEHADFVGCCGLRHYDLAAGIYEFGMHLLPAYWGQGLATEAGRAVIDHALGTLGAADLFAGHNPGNAASRAMLQKLGFHFVREEFYEPTGLMHPSYLYINKNLPPK